MRNSDTKISEGPALDTLDVDQLESLAKMRAIQLMGSEGVDASERARLLNIVSSDQPLQALYEMGPEMSQNTFYAAAPIAAQAKIRGLAK